jgi:hypothetical protein
VLARRFNLSRAEAKLTEAIVNGVQLADAAGIRLSTARTRLKRIQGEGSRMISVAPASLGSASEGQKGWPLATVAFLALEALLSVNDLTTYLLPG